MVNVLLANSKLKLNMFDVIKVKAFGGNFNLTGGLLKSARGNETDQLQRTNKYLMYARSTKNICDYNEPLMNYT